MRGGLDAIARLLLLTERTAASLERSSTCFARSINFASAADNSSFTSATSGKVFGRSNLVPRAVRFELTAQEAAGKFEEWQRSHWLAPSQLLTSPDTQLNARLLPFWLFETRVRVRYTGRTRQRQQEEGDGPEAGQQGAGGKDDEEGWEQQPWLEVPQRTYPWTRLAMQVYAGYEHRPTMAQAAKFEGSVGRSRPLTSHTAKQWATVSAQREPRGAPPLRVELGLPTMRQAIAWEFALAAIRKQEAMLAEEALKRRSRGGQVRDVDVEVSVLRRRARMLYLPAFVVHYTFGQSQNEHGERRDDVFEAVIGGTPEAGVSGERHFCPRKAQLTAASALGLASLAASAVAAPLVGLDPGLLLSVEGAFWVFLVGSLAGVAARLAPGLIRLSAENRRVQQEVQEFETVVSGGLGPMDVGDDKQEHVRTSAEWRRWSDASPWDWDPAKRRAWAERLWREQHRRRRERARFVERLRVEAERQRAEGEREARRQARWGHPGHHHQNSRFAGGAAGGTGPSYASGGGVGGGGQHFSWRPTKHDFLGYYRLLGLEPGRGGSLGPGGGSGQQQQAAGGREVGDADVKAAFRRAALRWHPDRLGGGAGEAERQRARDVFQQVQEAYNVLRDPELRKMYDAGRL